MKRLAFTIIFSTLVALSAHADGMPDSMKSTEPQPVVTQVQPVVPVAVPVVVETTPVVEQPVLLAQADAEATEKKSDDKVFKKGQSTLGLSAFGYYEANSDFDSLYNVTTSSSINTVGMGFAGYYDYAFGNHLSVEFTGGYSRKLDANRFNSLVEKDYFVGDVLSHYYFANSSLMATYATFGAGVEVSSGGAAPLLDVGVGNYFEVGDQFVIKTDLLYKTAIVLNRFELRLGVGYQF